MAVYHRVNSLKRLHENQEREQMIRVEIGEIRDALVEIAQIVSEMPSEVSETGEKGGDDCG